MTHRYNQPPPTLSAAEAIDVIGVSKQALYSRLKRGHAGIPHELVTPYPGARAVIMIPTDTVLALRTERSAAGLGVGALPWPEHAPHPPEVPDVPPMPRVHGIGMPSFRPF